MKLNKILGLALGLVFAGQVQAQNCNNPQGVYAMQASLAVSLMQETGRLQPLADLEVVNNRLAVSAIGAAKCGVAACPNVEAVLSMQDPAISQYISIDIFNPTIFSQRLVIEFQRQQIAAMRPDTDVNQAGADEHELTWNGITQGNCGVNYEYFITKDSTGAAYTTPEDLCTQLIFAGGQGTFNNGECQAQNPFLDFQIIEDGSQSIISVDPSADLVNFENSAIGSADVINSCYFVDATETAKDNACICEGTSGSLVASPSNSALFLCQ